MMWRELINIISHDHLITVSPKTTDSLSLWADYCELLCILSEANQIDQDQFISIIIKSSDFEDSEMNDSQCKNKDRLQPILVDVYSHIFLRDSMLQERYPFMINPDGQLCLKSTELTEIQILYLILLCASNIRYIKNYHCLTSDFEVICLEYMRLLFPSMIFKLFGSSNTNKKRDLQEDCFLDVKLKDRIRKLSEFVLLPCIEKNINNISEMNHGDNGLDIVGIRSMGDNRKSIPVMFGQCACSRDEWSQKQHSISRIEWSYYLEMTYTSIQRFIFVPFWDMNSDKQFENEMSIKECVLVDRLRIMMIAQDSFLQMCCSVDNN